MKRAWLLLSPLALCGCANLSAPSASVTVAETVAAPMLSNSQQLGLFDHPGKSTSGELFIGDSRDQVDELFPSMAAEDLPTTMAFANETPVTLRFVDGYSAEGFDNAGSGFGAIYYNKQLALAMKQDTGLTSDQVNEIEKAYEDKFGTPSSVTRNKVTYWFWEDAAHGQRLMICAVQSKGDSTKEDITVALGDDTVMDALRMVPKQAASDSRAFENNTPEQPEPHPGGT